MANNGKWRNLGWFAWFCIIAGVLTAGIVIALVVPFLSEEDELAAGNQEETQAAEEEAEPAAEQTETEAEIEKLQNTVGEEYADVGQFVAGMHEFYNSTTGYGRISNLNWSDQTGQAEEIIDALDTLAPQVDNASLKNDLEDIRKLANAVVEGQGTDNVRNLHRYFHDLDIALNEYDGYSEIWNVTETLQE